MLIPFVFETNFINPKCNNIKIIFNNTKPLNIVLSEKFRRSIENQHNPFGDGNAGKKIVAILEKELNKPNKKFLKKAFFDLAP